MLEQRTIVDRIELDRDVVVGVRFEKQVLNDGKALSEPRYHRCAIVPGQDPLQVQAEVDAHLVAMGEAAPTSTEWAKVFSVVESAHTPEAIADWTAKQAAK